MRDLKQEADGLLMTLSKQIEDSTREEKNSKTQSKANFAAVCSQFERSVSRMCLET